MYCAGSSLLLVNSSDSSDCEDHESSILAAVRAGALHPHHQELLHDRVLANRAPGSRPHSADRHHHHGGVGHHHAGGQGGHHDPFRNKSAQAGSDVVDELLKPLQSYFSVFRTGHIQGGQHGLLDELVNGGPPAHNTRSQDKRYRIKKQQQEGERSKKRGDRGDVVENGHLGPSHHHNVPMVPMPMGAPPPVNGFGPPQGHSGPPPRLDMETEIAHSLPPPNMAEPPPNMVPAPPYPPPHLQHPLLLPPMVGPPPPVLLSPAPTSPPTFSTPNEDQSRRSSEEQLELEISNMSIADPHPALPSQSINESDQQQEESTEHDHDQHEEDVVKAEQQLQAQQLTKDLFNLYSLSFLCKSKDLSERRIRLDFGMVAEVSYRGPNH